ncbi:hypothetical protein [Janibacter sp. Soil728]|uniref:hypothetical protein n=1 Tax=Janibacter sp. Soil728 TaxID=1736393 RepID=UPI000AC0DA12|nr:hypothetical protein [Janibacter sp. Soil728]
MYAGSSGSGTTQAAAVTSGSLTLAGLSTAYWVLLIFALIFTTFLLYRITVRTIRAMEP